MKILFLYLLSLVIHHGMSAEPLLERAKSALLVEEKNSQRVIQEAGPTGEPPVQLIQHIVEPTTSPANTTVLCWDHL